MTRVQNDILQALDNDGAAILILLDLSAAFDTIDHDILLHTLETHMMVSGQALQWFRSYLSDRTQSVCVQGAFSEKKSLNCGVPQGSVFGPILFSSYIQPLGKIISNTTLSYMLYADDSQLYISFKPNDPTSLCNVITAITSCVAHIRDWMSRHFLKLNDDKTEILVITTPALAHSVSISSLNLAGTEVQTVNSLRDLGITLDSRLQLQQHVKNIAKSAFYQLYRIARIRKYINQDAAKSLVHALVLSRIDYCNIALYGLPHCLIQKLQRVQNHAARLICGTHKLDHVSPVLQSLHWLPIKERLIYKMLLLAFKVLQGQAPKYLCDLLKPYIPPRMLRSSTQGLLEEPGFRLNTYGARSFQCAAPRLWNSLPIHIRTVSSLALFKRHLKTFLFRKAYNL